MKHSEAFEKLVANIKPNISELSIEAVLNELHTNVSSHLIDVREDHEFNSGYIKGALHLSRGIIERI